LFSIIYLLYYCSILALSNICCSISVISKYQLSKIAVSTTLSYQVIIASQITKKIMANIFLNIQFGELAHFALLINFCQNKEIISRTNPNQIA
jgi:hypothetical protein